MLGKLKNKAFDLTSVNNPLYSSIEAKYLNLDFSDALYTSAGDIGVLIDPVEYRLDTVLNDTVVDYLIGVIAYDSIIFTNYDRRYPIQEEDLPDLGTPPSFSSNTIVSILPSQGGCDEEIIYITVNWIEYAGGGVYIHHNEVHQVVFPAIWCIDEDLPEWEDPDNGGGGGPGCPLPPSCHEPCFLKLE